MRRCSFIRRICRRWIVRILLMSVRWRWRGGRWVSWSPVLLMPVLLMLVLLMLVRWGVAGDGTSGGEQV